MTGPVTHVYSTPERQGTRQPSVSKEQTSEAQGGGAGALTTAGRDGDCAEQSKCLWVPAVEGLR